jgi:hypothetical protein
MRMAIGRIIMIMIVVRSVVIDGSGGWCRCRDNEDRLEGNSHLRMTIELIQHVIEIANAGRNGLGRLGQVQQLALDHDGEG